MVAEQVPASTQSDGRWRIALTTLEEDPLSVADLLLAPLLTYSFTADGFNHTVTQATTEDKRLTLETDLSRPGKITETVEVTYVRSSDPDSAHALLTRGTEGHLTVRRSIDNAIEWTATTQKADVITFIAGVQRPNAPTENGVDTITQTLFITAPTRYEQALTA
jgi:hypothetical protein